VDEANTVLDDFRFKRYILVLDEVHHCEKAGIWEKSIAPLVEIAAFKIFLTGTIQRGNDNPIAFIDYDSDADGNLVPVMCDSEKIKVIEYNREDALREKAIIPLLFHLHDGVAEWNDEEGRTRRESLRSVSEKDAGAAVHTALATEYSNELLELAFRHWVKRQYDFPGSKLLVITAGIEHAKAAAEYISKKHYRVATATSQDSIHAQEMIKQFKGDRLDILVTVAIFYEGADVPGISHIACLTHVRSLPWIEQAIGRAVRVDPRFPYESQTGFIFAPDDPFFRKIVKAINAEQLPIAKAASEKAAKGTQKGLFSEESEFNNIYKITPIGSRLTGQRELRFSGCSTAASSHNDQPPAKTPSEIEVDLLVAIEAHVRAYCFANRYNPKRINTEIKRDFGGKSRALMHTEELDRVYAHLLERYPLNSIRGTGIPRCPTKAAPWP
jgi:superfamily II DNA or RNA helicase